MFLVAVENLVASLPGYTELPAHGRHGFPVQQAGDKGGGPAAIITDLAILRPYGPDHELRLASVHGGHTVNEVIARTGWDLKIIPAAVQTPSPTATELAALHHIDRDGFWRNKT